jgi:hypothetical protein
MKKILVVLSGITVLFLVIFNVSLINKNKTSYEMRFENIQSLTSEASCLKANTISGSTKNVTGNKYCYQDRTGPDLYAGAIKDCDPSNNPNSSQFCTKHECDTGRQGCYSSNQVPTSDNIFLNIENYV